MSITISQVYDAFVSAGAPEEKARRAAIGFVIAILSAVALKLFLH